VGWPGPINEHTAYLRLAAGIPHRRADRWLATAHTARTGGRPDLLRCHRHVLPGIPNALPRGPRGPRPQSAGVALDAAASSRGVRALAFDVADCTSSSTAAALRSIGHPPRAAVDQVVRLCRERSPTGRDGSATDSTTDWGTQRFAGPCHVIRTTPDPGRPTCSVATTSSARHDRGIGRFDSRQQRRRRRLPQTDIRSDSTRSPLSHFRA